MVTSMDNVLLDRHNWFTTALDTQGEGKVVIPDRGIVLSGPTQIVINRKNEIIMNMNVQDESLQDVSFVDIVINGCEIGALEVKTSEGVHTASKANRSNSYFTSDGSEPCSLGLSPSISEFIVSKNQPYYWVMPLANFVNSFLQYGELIEQHPLRLNNQAAVVQFLWQGKTAFIEPLLDYTQRVNQLENGEIKHLLTSVMVGEVGDNPIDIENLEKWFPATLLRVLGFATGHEVSVPWIEFRDADGKLVKRIHRDMGEPEFVTGHRIIEEFYHPLTEIFASAMNKTPLNVTATQYHLSKLLEAVQNTPFCKTTTYYVLLHQALIAGAGGQHLDERLTHLFRAFDRLCTNQGFRTVMLRNELTDADKTNAMDVLEKARKEIKLLASQAGRRGDIKAQNVLDCIAKRVKAADEKDREFGLAMCSLVQKFGFHDETVMNAYFASNPLGSKTTWASVLTLYRNVAIHDGYFNTSDPAFSQKNLCSMNVHLQDLLVRILLVMSGYEGPYHPIHATYGGSQDYIYRIQPDTSARNLGYK